MAYEEDFSTSFTGEDGFEDDINDMEDESLDENIGGEEDDFDDEFNEG